MNPNGSIGYQKMKEEKVAEVRKLIAEIFWLRKLLKEEKPLWEVVCDESYFHQWAVKRSGKTSFEDSFHVSSFEEAERLGKLLNSWVLE